MKFSLVIKPQINPNTRHRIEDALKEEGYTILGGGQSVGMALNECFSDISFDERDDPRDKGGEHAVR